MKFKLLTLLSLLLFVPYKSKAQKIVEKEKTNIEAQTTEKKLSDCQMYWNEIFPNDSLKRIYIDKIISINKRELSKNNLRFLRALESQQQSDLAFNKVLSPIFRLSKSEVGILSFPGYERVENKIIPISEELTLIEKFYSPTNDPTEYQKYFGKIRFYPIILDSVFEGRRKPKIHYYTVSKTGVTRIQDLGSYFDECLEYYEYSIDTKHISISDKLLFSSLLKIDLIYENNARVDSLITNQLKKECYDCPNSLHLQKTFARLKGTRNVYFVFADTFPINNKLDTPSRGLILVDKTGKIVYLWYDEIDLFGCSCL